MCTAVRQDFPRLQSYVDALLVAAHRFGYLEDRHLDDLVQALDDRDLTCLHLHSHPHAADAERMGMRENNMWHKNVCLEPTCSNVYPEKSDTA